MRMYSDSLATCRLTASMSLMMLALVFSAACVTPSEATPSEESTAADDQQDLDESATASQSPSSFYWPIHRQKPEFDAKLTRVDWEVQSLKLANVRARREKLERESPAVIQEFNRLIDSKPESPQQPAWRFQRAELMWELESEARLEAFLKRRSCLEAEQEPCTEPHQDYGEILKMYEDIVREYREFDRIDEVIFRVGEVSLATGLGVDAVGYWQRLVTHHPDSKYYGLSRLGLADFFMQKRTLGAALDNYNGTPELVAYSGYVEYQLGWVHYHREDGLDVAREFWAIAIEKTQSEALKQSICDELPFHTQPGEDRPACGEVLRGRSR